MFVICQNMTEDQAWQIFQHTFCKWTTVISWEYPIQYHTLKVILLIESYQFIFLNFLIFFFTFLFYIEVKQINNVVIASGGQQRDSAIHIHVSILPQTPLCATQ